MSWPGRLFGVVSFLGGCSFLGFHFLPTWLMAPLFFVTPAAGPLLLVLIGLLCIGRARQVSEKLTAARLVAATLVSCALVLLPVAVFDFLFFGTVPYIGPLILLVALPFHVVSVGVFGAGLYALAEAEGAAARARSIAVAAVAGFLSGIVVTAVRVEVVPRSRGVFLRGFSASGEALPVSRSPLAPYGQQDIQETLGAKPRSHHEPIVAIGDDGLWLARRSADSSCSGYWIERRGFATRTPQWRHCLAASAGVTRNPTAISGDRSGDVFLAGFDVRSGNESWWLQRYDAKGVEDSRWDKSFAATTRVDRAYGVWLSSDGSVYMSGESGDISLPGTFGWLRKFDADGREIVEGWTKQFPNAGERRPTMAAVAAAGDSAGDVYVLLDLFNAHSVRKFDAGGHELWQKDLPGHSDVAITAGADGLFVSGTSGYPDQAWIKKIDADGRDGWEKTFALGHLSSALAVAVDADRSVYVAGYGTEPGDKASYWWIKNLGPDGAERWHRVLSGSDNANVPFQLHRSAAGELFVLGKGNGWQFSGSALERYWGW